MRVALRVGVASVVAGLGLLAVATVSSAVSRIPSSAESVQSAAGAGLAGFGGALVVVVLVRRTPALAVLLPASVGLVLLAASQASRSLPTGSRRYASYTPADGIETVDWATLTSLLMPPVLLIAGAAFLLVAAAELLRRAVGRLRVA